MYWRYIHRHVFHSSVLSLPSLIPPTACATLYMQHLVSKIRFSGGAAGSPMLDTAGPAILACSRLSGGDARDTSDKWQQLSKWILELVVHQQQAAPTVSFSNRNRADNCLAVRVVPQLGLECGFVCHRREKDYRPAEAV